MQQQSTQKAVEPGFVVLFILFLVGVTVLLTILAFQGLNIINNPFLVVSAEVLVTVFVILISLPNNGRGTRLRTTERSDS